MIGEDKTESPIERMFYDAMRSWMKSESDFGLECHCQVQVGVLRVDFMLSAGDRPLLVVECDGHDWHERTKEQAARDKSRDRTILIDYGLPTLRYTGSEIFADAESCAHQSLRAAKTLHADIAWTEHLESSRKESDS